MVESLKTETKKGITQGILVGLLVVGAFVIGSLYTKVKYLEKETQAGVKVAGAQAQPQVQAKSKYDSFQDAAGAIAKDIKIDSKKLVSCLESGEKKDIVAADSAYGSGLGINGTPAFFINGRLVAGALPYSEFKKIIDEEIQGKADQSVTRQNVSLGNAPVKGRAGGPITMVVFSDFQCPYCQKVLATLDQILKEYDGKVLLAFKHFPLSSLHPHAEEAAQAAECAKDQGKFWEYHDKLFETQADWSLIQ